MHAPASCWLGSHTCRVLSCLSHRSPWLRAFVLGALDGLVSVACTIVGVSGGNPSLSLMRLTGISAWVACAMAMAMGEWVSVASQKVRLPTFSCDLLTRVRLPSSPGPTPLCVCCLRSCCHGRTVRRLTFRRSGMCKLRGRHIVHMSWKSWHRVGVRAGFGEAWQSVLRAKRVWPTQLSFGASPRVPMLARAPP